MPMAENGNGDYAGALVGRQTNGSITASYAARAMPMAETETVTMPVLWWAGRKAV